MKCYRGWMYSYQPKARKWVAGRHGKVVTQSTQQRLLRTIDNRIKRKKETGGV